MKRLSMAMLPLLFCFLFGTCAGPHPPYEPVLTPELALRSSQVPPACFAGEPISSDFNDLRVLHNDGYLVGFSPETRTPIWACYRLFEVADPPDLSRPDIDFATDLRAGVTVTHEDYTNTGYDRGHLAPSAGIGKCYGRDAQIGTFITSNICPQHPGLNQRCWERFENKVASDYSERLGAVWVVAGPIFDGPCKEFESDVRVPDAFYKIVVAEVDGRFEALGIVMENDRTERSPVRDYVRRIDDIEARAHLDFFHELDDVDEDELEADETPHDTWDIDWSLEPRFPGITRTIRVRDCD